MRNKIVTLTNENGQEVYLHCARVYEATDRKVVLEMDNEKQTNDLWWHIKTADQFKAEYKYRQEDKCIVLAVDQEIITAMYSY